MDNYERLRILLYQYINFKGDYYKHQAKVATDKLQRSKCLSSSEFQDIYRALIVNEVFDIIQMDIYNILKLH